MSVVCLSCSISDVEMWCKFCGVVGQVDDSNCSNYYFIIISLFSGEAACCCIDTPQGGERQAVEQPC